MIPFPMKSASLISETEIWPFALLAVRVFLLQEANFKGRNIRSNVPQDEDNMSHLVGTSCRFTQQRRIGLSR